MRAVPRRRCHRGGLTAHGSPVRYADCRSPESYAWDLATANQWTVLNVACGSPTVGNGLLGPEVLYNGQVAPPQLPRQGPAVPAPMHPNAAGDMAIALADQQARQRSPYRGLRRGAGPVIVPTTSIKGVAAA